MREPKDIWVTFINGEPAALYTDSRAAADASDYPNMAKTQYVSFEATKADVAKVVDLIIDDLTRHLDGKDGYQVKYKNPKISALIARLRLLAQTKAVAVQDPKELEALRALEHAVRSRGNVLLALEALTNRRIAAAAASPRVYGSVDSVTVGGITTRTSEEAIPRLKPEPSPTRENSRTTSDMLNLANTALSDFTGRTATDCESLWKATEHMLDYLWRMQAGLDALAKKPSHYTGSRFAALADFLRSQVSRACG